MITAFRKTAETFAAGAKTLPQRYFVSSEVFAEEQERIFSKQWVLVGHQGELAKAGDSLSVSRMDVRAGRSSPRCAAHGRRSGVRQGRLFTARGEPRVVGRIHFRQSGRLPCSAGGMVCAVGRKI